jgi:hypothetical protein
LQEIWRNATLCRWKRVILPSLRNNKLKPAQQ